ncbi:MAG: Mth938-like domain-containing protein [Calditrichia bacterium]
MNPIVQRTSFGSITIEGRDYHHDVIIRPNGEVQARKKSLSEKVFGTSHILSLEEAQATFENGVELLIIGSGQYGQLTLSQEAAEYFKKRNCQVILKPTPEAIRLWNQAGDKTMALFHLTC